MCPTAVHLEWAALVAAWKCLPQAVARPQRAVLATAALDISAVLVESAESQRQEACQAQVARLRHRAVPYRRRTSTLAQVMPTARRASGDRPRRTRASVPATSTAAEECQRPKRDARPIMRPGMPLAPVRLRKLSHVRAYYCAKETWRFPALRADASSHAHQRTMPRPTLRSLPLMAHPEAAEVVARVEPRRAAVA
jgi:hypothetical protein